MNGDRKKPKQLSSSGDPAKHSVELGERYLTRKEASQISGFSQDTFAKWAVLQKGPPYVKYGTGRSSRVRYPLSGLLEFLRCGHAETGTATP